VKRTFRTRSVLCFCFAALVTGCSLTGPESATLEQIDYFTRELEYYLDVDDDPETEQRELVLKKEFNSSKVQTKETEHGFEDGIKTVTNTYIFDGSGAKPAVPSEQTVYTYLDAADCDSDGDGVNDVSALRRISTIERFAANGEKTGIDSVTYDGNVTTAYSVIKTYRTDGETDVLESEQRATYYKNTDPDYNGSIRTEKKFSYDETDGYSLQKETAFWYEDDGSISHELDHVFRGDDNAEELYLYKPYSYTEDGKVYLISDYSYDDAGLSAGADGSAYGVTPADDDPYPYSIDYDSIGIQKNMTLFDYNDRGLVKRETLYTQGFVQEVRTYAYNDQDELVNKTRYISGGNVLEEKIVIRFREETIGGSQYLLKEIITYRFNSQVEAEE
jgi:hypothetical protein